MPHDAQVPKFAVLERLRPAVDVYERIQPFAETIRWNTEVMKRVDLCVERQLRQARSRTDYGHFVPDTSVSVELCE